MIIIINSKYDEEKTENEFDLWILIYMKLPAAETSTTQNNQNNYGKNDDFWCCTYMFITNLRWQSCSG